MKTAFVPFASREYEDAFEYYEAEGPGQGERFRRAVWATIGIIEEHTHIGREVRPGVRKILVQRFPYKLLYSIRGDMLRIIAVAHGHRKPDYWSDRA